MAVEPAAVEWIPGRVGGRRGHRLMVILAAPGCAWARRTGGCTNCSFPRSFGTGEPVTRADLIAQLDRAAARVPIEDDGPVELDLYVSGSFFNPEEIPGEGQLALLERAGLVPGCDRILVETRPEFATGAVLGAAVAAAAPLPLEVGIGLESSDPAVLRRIRKGFGWRELCSAARRLAAAGARLLVYVLLKPLDTGEAEAIGDAVRTAERVFTLGRELQLPTRVALEPCFVAPGTPLAEAFAEARYRPPWLWSVVVVARRIAPLGEVVVGLSDEGLDPAAVAHNCDACTLRFRRALARLNLDQNAEALGDIECECRDLWRHDQAS